MFVLLFSEFAAVTSTEIFNLLVDGIFRLRVYTFNSSRFRPQVNGGKSSTRANFYVQVMDKAINLIFPQWDVCFVDERRGLLCFKPIELGRMMSNEASVPFNSQNSKNFRTSIKVK